MFASDASGKFIFIVPLHGYFMYFMKSWKIKISVMAFKMLQMYVNIAWYYDKFSSERFRPTLVSVSDAVSAFTWTSLLIKF